MNKTTFTRLIQDSARISDADVQALEQVVQAFPYCHTAHMLLAKASNDRGSMLAPQRLRRAAIHAPSRALLKKLIESTPVAEPVLSISRPAEKAAAPVLTPAEVTVPAIPAYQEELEDLLDNDLPHNQLTYTTYAQEEAQSAPTSEPAQAETQTDAEATTPAFWPAELAGAELEEMPAAEPEAFEKPAEEVSAPDAPADTEIAAETDTEAAAIAVEISQETLTGLSVAEEPTADAETIVAIATEALATPLEMESGPADTQEHSLVEETDTTPIAEEEAVEEEFALEQEKAAVSDVGPVDQEQLNSESQIIDQTIIFADTAAEQVAERTEPEAEKPALSDEETSVPAEIDAVVASDEFPAEEIAPAAELVVEPVADIPSAYSESLIKAIFRDSELGYSMASSRMGESLEPKGELTRDIPFHFQPELLVEYSHIHAADRPATEPEVPQPLPQQELINEFLKKASKLKGRAQLTPKAEEQEDLSKKSTNLGKSLVSENLAQIFAMQGKTKKAIKIYQQLQLKIPEKKDYFAAQIVKLQNISS